jgi:toxin FitB
MILLDTNVLSELMRAKPAPEVLAWIDSQSSDQLFTSSITVAEILYGVARMADGKRKQGLLQLATLIFEEDFAGRILPFDTEAAVHYASLAAESEVKGTVVDMADGQIAAIAAFHDARVATRNVRHFDYLGVPVINPWEA